jgi:hypothetical protein
MEVHARTEKADASKLIRLLRSCRPHGERPDRRTAKPAMNSRRRISIPRVRSFWGKAYRDRSYMEMGLHLHDGASVRDVSFWPSASFAAVQQSICY